MDLFASHYFFYRVYQTVWAEEAGLGLSLVESNLYQALISQPRRQSKMEASLSYRFRNSAAKIGPLGALSDIMSEKVRIIIDTECCCCCFK